MIFVDGYEIDIASAETHAFESEATSYPVEEGADVTDHVRSQPIQVTLECIVSDTPVGDLASRRFTDTITDFTPGLEAYSKLLEIRNARRPVTIETSLATYTNMVMTSLSIPRSAETGDALSFTATFKQVEIVETERTSIRVSTPRAKPKQNLGSKAPEPTPPAPPPTATTERNTSILRDIYGK